MGRYSSNGSSVIQFKLGTRIAEYMSKITAEVLFSLPGFSPKSLKFFSSQGGGGKMIIVFVKTFYKKVIFLMVKWLGLRKVQT